MSGTMRKFPVFLALLIVVIAVLIMFLFPRIDDERDMGEEGDQRDISAVMVSGAYGYDNYATQADTCHTYQLLLKGGISRRNLIVMMAQDMAYHPKNVEQGVIRHGDGGPNVYLGFHMDYVGESFTLANFEAVIMGNKSLVNGGSGRVLSTNPNSRVFFFFSGHGGTSFTQFGRERLYADYLLTLLYHNHKQEKYESMVIYVSSCKSGSLFYYYDKIYKKMNIYVMTSARHDEVAFKMAASAIHRTSMGSQFAVSWTKDSETHNRTTRTLQQQYLKVKYRLEAYTNSPSSTAMQYGAKQLTNRTLDMYHGYDRNGPA